MRRRLVEAAVVFGLLCKVWRSKIISTRLKISIYKSAVVSVLTYGCEAWDFDSKTQIRLRAWSCRKVARITGRSFREEYSDPTVKVVGWVRAQRLKWAGQVLRAPEDYLPRRILQGDWITYGTREGGLLSDAPKMDFIGLVALALNIETWKEMVKIVRTLA